MGLNDNIPRPFSVLYRKKKAPFFAPKRPKDSLARQMHLWKGCVRFSFFVFFLWERLF